MSISPKSPVDLQSPSDRVIHVVATRENVDPLDLPPLYSAIDPDALDACIETVDSGAVEFEYAGHLVSVHSDGSVRIVDDTRSQTTGAAATDD